MCFTACYMSFTSTSSTLNSVLVSSEMSEQRTMTLSLEEKRKKISSNYETIRVLKDRLEERKEKERLGMTRAAYIKMIFDVTSKVDKQNDELGKAILDTRRLQKDIRNLGGRLERSFSLVEETFLREARNDAWNRECYRLLSLMHESCEQLLDAVQETGEIGREIRQLEDQIGQNRTSCQAAFVSG